MTHDYKFKNMVKGILAVVLLGSLAAGCSKKSDEKTGNDQNETREVDEAGLPGAESAIIDPEGHTAIIENADAIAEMAPVQEEMPAEASEGSQEVQIIDTTGGSESSSESQGSSTSAEETPAEQGQEVSEEPAEEPIDEGKEPGGF